MIHMVTLKPKLHVITSIVYNWNIICLMQNKSKKYRRNNNCLTKKNKRQNTKDKRQAKLAKYIQIQRGNITGVNLFIKCTGLCIFNVLYKFISYLICNIKK